MPFFFQPVVRQEFVFDTPFSRQEFSNVVSDWVTEDTDDSLGFVILPFLFFYELEGSLQHRSGWSTHKKTLLLNQGSCICERWKIIGFNPLINVCSFASLWYEVVSYSFYFIYRIASFIKLLRHSQDTAIWVSSDQNGIFQLLFDFSCNSGHLASCSNSDNQGINFSVALINDFLGQLVVVS